MKKLFAIAAMLVVFCLTGLVMTGEAQARRFWDNGNGTVTDTTTGLMWTTDANPFGTLNWQDAMSRCSAFTISGISGWRLPSKEELVALYHALQGGHPFTNVRRSTYWSSTVYEGLASQAWFVEMYNGYSGHGYKTDPGYVWPVRYRQ